MGGVTTAVFSSLALLPHPHFPLAPTRGTLQPPITRFSAACSSMQNDGFDLAKLRAEAAEAAQIIDAVEAKMDKIASGETDELITPALTELFEAGIVTRDEFERSVDPEEALLLRIDGAVERLLSAKRGGAKLSLPGAIAATVDSSAGTWMRSPITAAVGTLLAPAVALIAARAALMSRQEAQAGAEAAEAAAAVAAAERMTAERAKVLQVVAEAEAELEAAEAGAAKAKAELEAAESEAAAEEAAAAEEEAEEAAEAEAELRRLLSDPYMLRRNGTAARKVIGDAASHAQ